jgi:hypothetical protein
MDKKKLLGMFLKGSVRNGQKFYGRCIDVDDMFITLSGIPNSDNNGKKIVLISEIAEFYVEDFMQGGKI